MTWRLWILALLLAATSVRLQAATINAASCSITDVNNAINAVSTVDGDTVVIPSGTCFWPSGLSLSKMITIRGAGVDQTIIKSSNADNVNVLTWNLHASGGPAIIMDLTLDTNNTFSNQSAGGTAMLIIQGTTAATCTTPTSSCFMMRRIKVVEPRAEGFILRGDVRGVASEFTCTSVYQSDVCGQVMHSGWGNVGAFGDNSWAVAHTMGTTAAFVFEDSIFDCIRDASYAGYCPAMNLFSGGRRVVRFSRVSNTQVYQHSLDTPYRDRGARQDEIYRNVSVNAAVWSSGTFALRGGTFRVFDNTVTGGSGGVVDGQYQRGDAVPVINPVNPWGDCRVRTIVSISCSAGLATVTMTAGGSPHGLQDVAYTEIQGSHANYNGVRQVSGTGNYRQSPSFQFTATCAGTVAGGTIRAPWDGNTGTNGYPCTDQFGRGAGTLLSGESYTFNMVTSPVNQASEPGYASGNLKDGGSLNFFLAAGDATVTQANRDYFNVPKGTRASRAACSFEGQGHFSTDGGGNWNTESAQQHANHDPANASHTVGADGALDRCNAGLTWVNDWYVPLVYPHPMISGVVGNAPPNLSISSHGGDVNTTASTAALVGNCTDDVGCPSVTYSCAPSCGSGTATGVNPWSQTASLPVGVSTWTVSVTDAGGLTSTASVRFYRVAAAAALPFTETFSAGTGITWTNGYGSNWTRVGVPQFGISNQQGTTTVFGFSGILFTGLPLNGDQYIEATVVDVAPLSKQIRFCLNATGTIGTTADFDGYVVQFDGTNSATNIIGRYDDGALTTNYTPSGLGNIEVVPGSIVGAVKSGTTIRAIVDGFPVGPIITTAGEYVGGTVGDCSVGIGTKIDNLTVGNSTPTPPDLTAPVVAIDMPTTETGYASASGSVVVEAAVSDNIAVTSCTLTNSQIAGTTPLTPAAGRVMTTVTLVQGLGTVYTLTISCRDAANNTGTDTLTVSTQTAPPPQGRPVNLRGIFR